MFRISTTSIRWLQWMLALGLMAATANARELRRVPAPCRTAVPVLVNETWRSSGGAAGEAHCVEIEVPARGLLTIDLSSAPAGARLDVLDPTGRGRVASCGDFGFVKYSAASQVLLIGAPGSYRVRVTSVDPLLALPAYKLRTAFAEEWDDISKGEHDGESEIDPDPLKGEHDGESEIDPDPLIYCPAPDGLAKGEHDGESEIDPDPLKGEHDGESEIDPDPAKAASDVYDLAAAPAALRAELAELCHRGEVDDHGDTFACATPVRVNRTAVGEIRNGWGDDEDVFRFRLTAPRTVVVESGGFADARAELFDRFGNRLGGDDDGGEGDNFRLVRTLSPGVYFVRVEAGIAAAGSYSLAVRTLP